MMAYSYQELTDPELDEYIQFYEMTEGRWFITQTVKSVSVFPFHRDMLFLRTQGAMIDNRQC